MSDRLDKIRRRLAAAQEAVQPWGGILTDTIADAVWLVAEVERLRNEGERDATTVELCMAETREAKAEVAHLRGLLDEPSNEELFRLAGLAFAAGGIYANMGNVVLALLADLRERAGGGGGEPE